jgi:molecular chaperone DnaK (HSP70)
VRPDPVVCLDFGTTKTLVAAGDHVLPLGRLDRWMPSLVGLDHTGAILLGEEADLADPELRIRSIKRAITKRRNDIRDTAIATVRRTSADELIVALLDRVADRAAAQGVDLRRPRTLAVGCPSVWDSGQRRRFVRLLNAAGIPASLADLVDEPVAAGIAWLERQSLSGVTPLRLVVFDMGGGTLDVAVIDVLGPGEDDIHLLAAVGRAEAGDTLDEAIADDLARDLGLADDDPEVDAPLAGPNFADPGFAHPDLDDTDLADPDARRRRDLLLDAARRLKVALTTEEEAVAPLARDLFAPITEVWYQRPRLEAVFAPQMDRAVELVHVALRIAHLSTGTPDAPPEPAPSPEQLLAGVDVVLLAGGMSRVPYVTHRLRQLFGPRPTIAVACDPPEEAVVRGLAAAGRYRTNVRYALDYDILLEWDDGQRSCSLYEACMPILESWWIERNWQGELRFLCTGRGLDLPRQGTGVLRVAGRAHPVAATLNGASLDGYPVALNGDDFELAIYPSGRITMTDGAGHHVGRAR